MRIGTIGVDHPSVHCRKRHTNSRSASDVHAIKPSVADSWSTEMDNAEFKKGSRKFNYRVAGLCVHDGYALLHRAETDNFWALPGGRCHIGEPSDQAIERELHEELGITIRVTRVLWFVESFFGNTIEQVHQLACYYLFELPAGAPLLAKDQIHTGIEEDDLKLIFRWFPYSELPATRLYPTFLRTEIANLPEVPTHLIHYDEDDEAES